MEKKILVADDSLTIQKVVELTFSDSDYRLTCVSNGMLALEKVRADPPDLILADVVMPEKNGYEVCEEIKSNPATASIPVVLLAGTFEPFDRERAERLRCDAIVSKPFDSHQLFLKVESLLASRSHGGRSTAPVSADPLEATPPAAYHFPSVPPDPFNAGFAEEDFTGSIRNLRGKGSEEPLESLYGPEDVESALAAFREVEPTSRATDWRGAARLSDPEPVARITQEAIAHGPEGAGEAGEPAEPGANEDGRTQRIDVSQYRTGSAARPASPPEEAPAEKPVLQSPAPEPVIAASGEAARDSGSSSPELSEAEIERIAERVARRVIEKLSDRIVREVAWEVVPETAELAVRERIRELESGVE
jgi:CheY-like chemotaxis protein